MPRPEVTGLSVVGGSAAAGASSKGDRRTALAVRRTGVVGGGGGGSGGLSAAGGGKFSASRNRTCKCAAVFDLFWSFVEHKSRVHATIAVI